MKEKKEINRHKAALQAAKAMMAFLGYDHYIPRLIELYDNDNSLQSARGGKEKAIRKGDVE